VAPATVVPVVRWSRHCSRSGWLRSDGNGDSGSGEGSLSRKLPDLAPLLQELRLSGGNSSVLSSVARYF